MITVEVVQVGPMAAGVSLTRVAKMFAGDAGIRIVLRPDSIDLSTIPKPPAGHFFYSEREILSAVEPSTECDLLFCVTALRIAPSSEAAGEDEYFGLWDNEFVELEQADRFKGIASVARWREKFAGPAYRSTEQYLAFMLLAFVGDVQLGGLTHAWCTGCVFDYNVDEESIVSSVKSATLCPVCRKRLSDVDPNLVAAFARVLSFVKRPPFYAVLSYLQGNGFAAVFLFAVLLGIAVGFLQNLWADAKLTSFLVAAGSASAFALVVLGLRRWPMGDLT